MTEIKRKNKQKNEIEVLMRSNEELDTYLRSQK